MSTNRACTEIWQSLCPCCRCDRLRANRRFGRAERRGVACGAAAADGDSSDDEGAAELEARMLSEEEALIVTNRLHQASCGTMEQLRDGWHSGHTGCSAFKGRDALAACQAFTSTCLRLLDFANRTLSPFIYSTPIGAASLHAAPPEGDGGLGAACQAGAPAAGQVLGRREGSGVRLCLDGRVHACCRRRMQNPVLMSTAQPPAPLTGAQIASSGRTGLLPH